MSIFTFLMFSYRGNWQILGTFFGMKTYCFKPKVLHLKKHTIALRMQTLIEIFSKSTSKSTFSATVFEIYRVVWG